MPKWRPMSAWRNGLGRGHHQHDIHPGNGDDEHDYVNLRISISGIDCHNAVRRVLYNVT
jgi:hypothetical protein